MNKSSRIFTFFKHWNTNAAAGEEGSPDNRARQRRWQVALSQKAQTLPCRKASSKGNKRLAMRQKKIRGSSKEEELTGDGQGHRRRRQRRRRHRRGARRGRIVFLIILILRRREQPGPLGPAGTTVERRRHLLLALHVHRHGARHRGRRRITRSAPLEDVVHLAVEEPREPPLPARVVAHGPERGLLPGREAAALPLPDLLVVAGEVAPALAALHGPAVHAVAPAVLRHRRPLGWLRALAAGAASSPGPAPAAPAPAPLHHPLPLDEHQDLLPRPPRQPRPAPGPHASSLAGARHGRPGRPTASSPWPAARQEPVQQATGTQGSREGRQGRLSGCPSTPKLGIRREWT
ncbi:hypothetical protein SEVIR_7G086950v4 [Setaria viridis]